MMTDQSNRFLQIDAGSRRFFGTYFLLYFEGTLYACSFNEDKDFVEEMQKEMFYVLPKVQKKLRLNKCRRIINEKTGCFVTVSHRVKIRGYEKMLSVLGFPRTGFTLLISIIIELRNLHGIQTKKQIFRRQTSKNGALSKYRSKKDRDFSWKK